MKKRFTYAFLILQTSRKRSKNGKKSLSLGGKSRNTGSKDLNNLDLTIGFKTIGGVYFSGDTHLSPNELISKLKSTLKEKGVEFLSKPQILSVLTESKVAITPMGNNLRISGILGLSDRSKYVNRKKVDGLLENLSLHYKSIQVPKVRTQDIWVGYRLCSHDGLPYIGKV